MVAPEQRQPDAERSQPEPGDGPVKSWPWVSLNIPPAQLAEFTALAARLHRSRADLLREVLEQVGLPYARAVAGTRAAADPGARRGVNAR